MREAHTRCTFGLFYETKMRFTFALVSAIAVAGVAASANARDYISIAGPPASSATRHMK